MGFWIALIVLGALIAAYAFFGSQLVAHFKNMRDPDRYVVSRTYFDAQQKEPVVVYPMGYPVVGDLIRCAGAARAVLVVHGITASRKTVCDYAELFHHEGCHVLLIDLPNHGESGGDHRSFGYYEKRAVLACMNFLRGRFGALTEIGLWGISMGASTVLLAAAAGADCRFVVADCAFEDLSFALAHTMLRPLLPRTERMPLRLARILLSPPSLMTLLRFGWLFRSCSPIDVIHKIRVPVLFIHGKQDSFVPVRNSIDLHNKRISLGLPSRLELFDARHAQSFHSDPQHYKAVVREFLRSF